MIARRLFSRYCLGQVKEYILSFDFLCSFTQHERMYVDRKPFSSCLNFVNVALVWPLLISFPLSGKCWIAVQTMDCGQNPNYL